MKVLIIGLGSIARKHIVSLRKINPRIEIFALRSNEQSTNEIGVGNIFSISELPSPVDFCIISNPTHLHFDSISNALTLKVPLFIEKPSLMSLDNSQRLIENINQNKIQTYVAFNLRFHPILTFLKENIDPENVVEANVYCGSFLPNWRPLVDYTKIYSSIKEMGGGVHLDLIHEIDYSTWLFGFPDSSISLKRKVSKLKIDSYDFANYNLLYPDKTVNIVLNYYRQQPKRKIEILTNSGVITADLLSQKVYNENGKVLFQSQSTILDTYDYQMKYFIKALNNKTTTFNTFEESLKNLKICLQ